MKYRDAEIILGDYRKTPEWAARKEEYLACLAEVGSGELICEVCGRDEVRKIEHLRLNQNRLSGDDEDWDIIGLCIGCLAKFKMKKGTRRRRTYFLFGGKDNVPEEKRRYGGGRKVRWARYLDSPEWKSRRLEFLKLNPNCLNCKTDSNLHVHHANYSSFNKFGPGGELDSHLRTLCEDCHFSLHDLQKAEKLTVLQATKRFLEED